MLFSRAEKFDHNFGKKIAGAGYVALVPAYAKFGRQGYTAAITEDLRAVASWFRARPETRSDRFGAVGFSAGAFHAARLALFDETLKAVVGYYGPYDLSAVSFKNSVRRWDYLSPIHNVEKLSAAVLILHGDKDAETPITQARSFEQALKSAGKTAELVTYRGSHHRFDRGKSNKMKGERTKSGHIYRLNKGARDDAWKRTIKWLNSHLHK
jgi:dienelactone hydrolase